MKKFKLNKYIIISFFAVIISFFVGLNFNLSSSKNLNGDNIESSFNANDNSVKSESAYIEPDYKHIEIDEEIYLTKIFNNYEKELDIENLIKFKKTNIIDKEKISELIKSLPLNKYGNIVDIEFKKTPDNSNMIEIAFDFNENEVLEDITSILEFNTFIIQCLVKDAHIINFNTNKNLYVGGYDYFKEFFDIK